MKTGLPDRIRWGQGLGFRLATMLSIALIPLGVIAIAQTTRVVDHAEAISETALEGRTESAAAGTRTLIETALGTGQALGTAVLESGASPAGCSEMLRHFTGTTPYVLYVGFADLNGQIRCGSDTTVRDIGKTGFFARASNSGAPVVSTSQKLFPGQSILVLTQPVTEGDTRVGYLVMAIRPTPLDAGMPPDPGEQPFSFVIFNADGEILNATEDLAAAARMMPRSRDPAALAGTAEGAFRDLAADGQRRIYTVVPILSGSVYALGSWTPGERLLAGLFAPGALMFPVAMWLASLGVAYFAVQRLVLRHIAVLRGQMRRFALGEREMPPEVLVEAPAEIREVSQTFHNLARILIREERQLADSLREKTVLLREVHHRVKNNLQLIASIMNMQMRQVQEPDARRVLKSVQDRVASLATIHRNLYQAEMLASVRADRLLGDIVNQMAILSGVPGQEVAVETAFDPIALNPDQSVPVALLTTEALTNAIKYSTPDPADGKRHVRLSLTDLGDGAARLRIVSSLGASGASAAYGDAAGGTGLGSRLIDAFARQLDADLVHGPAADGYEVSVRFRIETAPADEEAPDQ